MTIAEFMVPISPIWNVVYQINEFLTHNLRSLLEHSPYIGMLFGIRSVINKIIVVNIIMTSVASSIISLYFQCVKLYIHILKVCCFTSEEHA